MVVYRVSAGAIESGVVAGPAFFRGFPLPGASDPRVHFAIFAYPYDAPPGTQLRLRARDEAANEVLANFHLKVDRKAFRSRSLPVDDAFLEKVVPEIMSQSPSLQDQGDLLKNYLAINRDLRKANNAQLGELASRSQERFLWSQPFQQLGNSKVEAAFADHRTYTYKGRDIDRQDHLGYDLASTAHAPVSASNDGVVVMADFFGIYGNTVVIDHGYGLLVPVRPPEQLRGQGRRRGEARPDHRPKRGQRPRRRRPPALLDGPAVGAGRSEGVVGSPLDQGPHHVEAGAVRGRRAHALAAGGRQRLGSWA